VREKEWFLKKLIEEYGVKVNERSLSTEGHLLFLVEVNESIIPVEYKEKLPESLLFETLQIEDEEGTEWIGVIGMDEDTRIWCVQILLKDGEQINFEVIEGGS